MAGGSRQNLGCGSDPAKKKAATNDVNSAESYRILELTCIMTVCRKMPGFAEVPFAKLYNTRASFPFLFFGRSGYVGATTS